MSLIRPAAVVLALTLAVGLVACTAAPELSPAAETPSSTPTQTSTPSPTPTPSAMATPIATPTPAPAPTKAPAPSPTKAPAPIPTPIVTPAFNADDLINTCLYNASRPRNKPRPDLYDQLMRSDVPREEARLAFRPDGEWYVVIPIVDPFMSVPWELNCTTRPDRWVTFVASRPSPKIDDFDRWASGELPGSGGL
ncbi:hypothetical protein [Microbacterium sp. SSM24]|uniref:hypothetical protein n=1 Tax=Microbacterium sp. SSM24 TaxID=2991714 RepID=UPI00222685BC|nr:hypothetical protein [Microbacterium sp. SSM24]MCW3492756.1 hypothetical protein [Microbacterium sp. SSM24]